MRSRSLFWMSLLGLCFTAAVLPRTASAALRVPQVPVLGNALQSYFVSIGEHIDVSADQFDIQRWSPPTPSKPTYTVLFAVERKPAGVSVGLYNASDASPTLYPMFPPEATRGWFAAASFRTLPALVSITVWDANLVIHSSNTYLGANKDDFAFYLSGPDGVFHTQDARNPGGNAQWLVYAGTGINAGSWWLAGEADAIAGGSSDSGFADVVLFFENNSCACSGVERASWSALKSRFR